MNSCSYFVCAPTATGKSAFAIRLAKKIGGIIVNADSMQVYSNLEILTARPSKKDQKNIKHHLYGFQDVKKKFSTGKWLNLVVKKIKVIKKKNKIPILVGGTGLYFKSLTDGLVKIPTISIKNRNKIRSLQKNVGQKKFYKMLINLDPYAKTKINDNDIQRSIRAYEIKKFTKLSITEWFKNTKSLFKEDNFLKIYIDFPRQDLLDKIKKRIDKMFKEGVILEVKRFNKLNLKKEHSVNKVIGVEEIRKYLNGDWNLDQVKEGILIKTRQYAKRQTTWARGQMTSWQKIHHKDIVSALKKFK